MPANYILHRHYTALTGELVKPISIGRLLHTENVISKEALESIKSTPQSARRQSLFTAIQNAVYVNPLHLETFGNALCKFTENVPLGTDILKDYSKFV